MEVLSSLEVLNFETILPYITVILVILVAIFSGYFKFKVSKKLPPGSLGFPVIGESISFLRAQKQDKTNEWIRSRINKYGPVFKTSLMGSKAIVLTGQAGNRFMFGGGDNGIASNQPVSVARILGKYSVFELPPTRHKIFRTAIMSFLKPESIQRYVGEMDSLIQQQLKQELSGKDSIKAIRFIKKITFKVTCSLLFRLPEGEEKDALLKDFTIALRGTWALPLDVPGTIFQKALQARVRICKLLSDLIRKRKRETSDQGSHRHEEEEEEDVMSIFLNTKNENDELLSEEEIIDGFISLIIASHDTTTVVLCLLIRHLARDAEVFDKVLQEQMEVVKAKEGNRGKILTWNVMQMMKYTWRVTQELMRMTPPVIGNFKCAWRDTNFGGFDIPKGWQVFWVSSGTQMDGEIFQEPEKFDPSRFESSPSKSYPPYTYIPFGAGPKICPGAEFARIEMLLIIHHLITNYRWTEMIPNEPITRKPMPYPAMGLPINLYPRKLAE